MGRPQQVGLMYFPLDTDFFYASKKIKALRRAYGSIGITVYLNILCRVYANGYYYQFDDYDDLIKDIAEDIVGEREQIRHIAAKVSETLHYMAELGLINKNLFEMNVISSKAIQEQFAESIRKAKRNTKIGIYNLVDVNVVAPENGVSSEEKHVSSEEMGVSSEESAQSKVNKNKYTTTTTLPRVCAREEKPEPPDLIRDIVPYFRDELCMDQPTVEAATFYAWNKNHGWTCLPDWQSAAELWQARESCPKNQ